MVLGKVLVVDAASESRKMDALPAEEPYTETNAASRNAIATSSVTDERNSYTKVPGGNDVESNQNEVRHLTIMAASEANEARQRQREEQATEERLEIEASENEADDSDEIQAGEDDDQPKGMIGIFAATDGSPTYEPEDEETKVEVKEEIREEGDEPKAMIGYDSATGSESKATEGKETIKAEEETQEYYWDGPVLNAYIGVVEGPSGKETYYNLPMDGVIAIMRDLGYDEENYPYSINEDGCKCLGGYIMVAANLELRPKGTIVPTSLGWGIVADTGTFAQTNRTQLDIAVNW